MKKLKISGDSTPPWVPRHALGLLSRVGHVETFDHPLDPRASLHRKSALIIAVFDIGDFFSGYPAIGAPEIDERNREGCFWLRFV